MKTIEERATEVVAEYGYPELIELRSAIGRSMRELVQEILHVIEEGNRPRKGLTDHVFRRGGPLGLCTCGLQKAAHPGRSASRNKIMEEIASLIADPEPAGEVEDRFKPGGFYIPWK